MIPREKLQQHFREEYDRLNEQQRRAVDRIEGPVMVIAGPGTGKTQILAARIGKILLDTDASPANILCLTYTDAGVTAMRRRLVHFIGSDAHKVNIYTFHAFCNDIIQENLSFFEKSDLDPISDLERIQLLQTLIDELPLDNPLKRLNSDGQREIGSLSALFSTMKKEGWKTADILASIDAYVDDLPNRDAYIAKKASGIYRKGDVRTDRVAAETERMTKLAAAVKQFDRFQLMMRARNRYDFDDMINWVIRAFEENPGLLLNYQERYQYILVDEYQDTSGSQNRLVELLVSYWDQPNIFVVGDDDQSIYRFQGANVENMEKFVANYSRDLFKVVLVNNYRSTQPILDVSQSLIARNQERLIAKMQGLSKDLIASHPEISLLTHPPTILEYETERREKAGITLKVQELIANGVPPGKIAIIFKENKFGEELARFFRHKSIPAYSRKSINLLDVPLARKIIRILQFLAAELEAPYKGDSLLFEILHFDCFDIPPIEIARLSVEVAQRQYGDTPTSLRALLYERANNAPRDLFDKGLHPNLKKTSAVLEKLIADVVNITLQTLLEHIIRTTGLLGQVMRSADKLWQIEVLTTLFDFVKDETRRNPDLTVGGLTETIELMKRNDVSLPLIEVGGSDKGVNLLTAHGSKGLEFEYVFLAGTNAQLWEKKRKRSETFRFPDTVFSSHPVTSDEEEMRRLFYVAITRAQKQLFITHAAFNNQNKALEPSQFMQEILDIHEVPCEKVSIDTDALADFQMLQLIDSGAPEIEKTESTFIDRLLEGFVMNVTALNSYLRCPLEFYFRQLLRIPSPKNENLEFGSAVHFALQRLFEKMKADPEEKFPPREALIGDFNWYMNRHRESFTGTAFERRVEHGKNVLGAYYDRYVHEWNRFVKIEMNIRNVTVNDVPIKGKLDKLEFAGNDVTVVDYKTGNPDGDGPRKKLRAPDIKHPVGGDYWRQAVFYKILVDSMQKKWNVVSCEFDFVEPDKKKDHVKKRLFITQEDVAAVTTEITTTWQKIQAHDFYTGCGKSDCQYCDFIKTNGLYKTLHDTEEEEET